MKHLLVGCLVLLGVMTTSRLNAAFDAFLKLDGIEGEVRDQDHAKEILIDSFSFGVSNTPVAGGGGTGKASFSDLSFTKLLDKSSPQLYLHCAQGKPIRSAVLTLRKSGGDRNEFYVVTLTDVLVTSVQTGGASSGQPTESFSLNYTKIEWKYVPEDDTGAQLPPVITSWDLQAGTP